MPLASVGLQANRPIRLRTSLSRAQIKTSKRFPTFSLTFDICLALGPWNLALLPWGLASAAPPLDPRHTCIRHTHALGMTASCSARFGKQIGLSVQGAA